MNGTLPRFLTAGVVNTAVGLAVIVVARDMLGLGDIAANASGYAAGLLIGFAVNRAWTFRHSGAALPSFLRFLLVFALAYAANLAVLGATLEPLSPWPYLPHLLGMIVYTGIFYAGSRLVAFRS